MRNIIQNYDPRTSLSEQVSQLERKFEQLKTNAQPPTMLQSNTGVVYTDPPLVPTRVYYFSSLAPNAYRSHTYSAQVTLTPAVSIPILFGYVQTSLYLYDVDNPKLIKLFPHVTPFSADGWGYASSNYPYEHILNLQSWASSYRSNGKNLVSVVRLTRSDYGAVGLVESDNNPDGATSGSLNLQMRFSYRYIRGGSASQA